MTNTLIVSLDTRSLGSVRSLHLDRARVAELQVVSLKSLGQLDVRYTPIMFLDLRVCAALCWVRGCTDNGRDILTAPGVERDDNNMW